MNAKQHKKIEQLAKEIHTFLVKNELWIDVHIYFNGKCWGTNSKDGTEFCYNQNKYFEYEANPKDYFEYVAEPNILSMSFEGSLYEVLNGYWGAKLEEEFSKILEKHGLYYELGNSWNLTCCEI